MQFQVSINGITTLKIQNSSKRQSNDFYQEQLFFVGLINLSETIYSPAF